MKKATISVAVMSTVFGGFAQEAQQRIEEPTEAQAQEELTKRRLLRVLKQHPGLARAYNQLHEENVDLAEAYFNASLQFLTAAGSVGGLIGDLKPLVNLNEEKFREYVEEHGETEARKIVLRLRNASSRISSAKNSLTAMRRYLNLIIGALTEYEEAHGGATAVFHKAESHLLELSALLDKATRVVNALERGINRSRENLGIGRRTSPEQVVEEVQQE